MCGIRKGRQRGLLIPMGEGSGIRATDGVSDINTHKTGHPLPIGRVIDLPSSRKPGNGKSWQITNLFQYLYVYIYTWIVWSIQELQKQVIYMDILYGFV